MTYYKNGYTILFLNSARAQIDSPYKST